MAPHPPADINQSVTHLLRTTTAFLVVAWFFIILRIWTRTFVISSFGWDDGTMILAGLVFTVYCVATLLVDHHGARGVISSFEQLQVLTKLMTTAETSYIWTMMFVKTSLAIFFARIVIKPWHLALIKVTLCINFTSSISAFFYIIFRCGPNLDNYATQMILEKCSSHNFDIFMAYQQAAFNTFTDVIFISMPILVLWKSQMKLQTKIPVCAILLVATLGAICSMVRFKYVGGLLKMGDPDFFWTAVNISIWSTAEAGTCIMAGCLATLRPLLKLVIDRANISTPSYKSAFSSFIKNSHRSNRHSMRIERLSESDLLYSGTDKKTSGPQITAQPAYVELVTRPPAAHVAPSSDAGNKHAQLQQGGSTHCLLEQQQSRSEPASPSLP